MLPQKSLLMHQEDVFDQMEQNWMCVQLKEIYPSHFECSGQNHDWKLPLTDSLFIFGKRYPITQDEQRQYAALLLPGGDCKRLLTLASLCDLYFPLFRKKTQAAGLHKDVVWLPVLLSGCNTSYAAHGGRKGLWAMDYLTARKQHLRIDSLIDERMGSDFTTDAAIKNILELSILFDNDYEKIITALRQGVPFVRRVEDANDSQHFFNSLDEDSQQFLKLLAYVKTLIESMRTENQLLHYFDILGQQQNLVFTEKVTINALAAVLGTTEKQLHKWNPVYIGNTIEAGYRKIPFMVEETMAAKYEVLKDSVTKWKPMPPLTLASKNPKEPSVIYHKVKEGESLGRIAARYHTTVKKLKLWNKLKNDKLKIGQLLTIYTDESETTVENTDKQTENKPKAEKPKTPVQQTTEIKQENKSKTDNSATTTYTVKRGDSLWEIAKKYKGVTPEEIMKWNNCGEKLQPGQKLIIHL